MLLAILKQICQWSFQAHQRVRRQERKDAPTVTITSMLPDLTRASRSQACFQISRRLLDLKHASRSHAGAASIVSNTSQIRIASKVAIWPQTPGHRCTGEWSGLLRDRTSPRPGTRCGQLRRSGGSHSLSCTLIASGSQACF